MTCEPAIINKPKIPKHFAEVNYLLLKARLAKASIDTGGSGPLAKRRQPTCTCLYLFATACQWTKFADHLFETPAKLMATWYNVEGMSSSQVA
jgi:hypothetical protein